MCIRDRARSERGRQYLERREDPGPGILVDPGPIAGALIIEDDIDVRVIVQVERSEPQAGIVRWSNRAGGGEHSSPLVPKAGDLVLLGRSHENVHVRITIHIGDDRP